MHCLFQKSHLVPLCHCLQEEKGKLKSIILTCASFIAEELNSISSAANRGQGLAAANWGTSQQASCASGAEGRTLWSACVQWQRSHCHAWGQSLGCHMCEAASAGVGLTKPFREILWEWRWAWAISLVRCAADQLPPALRAATPTNKWNQFRRHLASWKAASLPLQAKNEVPCG